MPSHFVFGSLDDERSTHFELLSLLRKGNAFTQAEMVDVLPISSKRQARRLLRRLREKGIPIKEAYRGREKEYWLSPEEWEAEVRLDLTEREALALMLAAGAAIRSWLRRGRHKACGHREGWA